VAISRDSLEMNLNQPAFFQDPYPFYTRMRASGRPFWLPHEQNATSRGVWLFSRHADALAIFKQTQSISKNVQSVRPDGKGTAFDLHMLHRDDPDHLRLRRLVADQFAPAALALREPRLAAVAQELALALPRTGRIDLVADFAEKLPLRMIGDMLDVPRADLGKIRAWCLAFGYGFDSVIASPEILARQREALGAFLDYVRQLVARQEGTTAPGLLAHLVAAERGGMLSPEELTGMVAFLLFAGHETTISLIASALQLLLRHPEQWQRLRQAPELLPGAVEEVLRYESPDQRTSFRVAREPLEIGGFNLEAGQQLGVLIGSANRDEAEFADSDRFDITRSPNRHLAFGIGPYQCLGKQLARMEARIAIARISECCPNIRLLDEAPDWRRNSFFRGLASLPATLLR
jgi:pimeloyl-[acyl-carrier protein] synthase